MSDYEAIVLIGHGSRRVEANTALDRLCRLVQATGDPEIRVEAAFLQFAAPGISAVITRLADEGLRRIVLVPIFFYEGAHVAHDIPQVIEAERAARPDLPLTLAPVLGIDERIAEIVWDRVAQAQA